MKMDLFQFNDPIDYLNFELERRKIKNPNYSLRAWSRQLEFKNPAFLSQILTKTRGLKLPLAKKMSLQLKLSSQEAKYFESLVLLANAKTVEEKSLLHGILEALRPPGVSEDFNMTLDIFKFISDWYHIAILEVLNLKDYDGSVDFIVSKLYPEVSRSEVLKALKRLARLELVVESSSGQIKRAKESKHLVDQHLPSEAIRGFHTQMIQKSLQAIEGQSTEQRDLRGSTLCLRKKDFAKAKEILRETHNQLTALSRSGDGDFVCQINSQIFTLVPLSKGDSL